MFMRITMLLKDMMNACAHEKVAEAALASIGGAFHARVRKAAHHRRQTPGAYAATSVTLFRTQADAHAYTQLSDAIRGTDRPILAGLRLIVERTLTC